MTDDHPPCETCHGPVERREKESVYLWRRRPTCSRRCGRAHQLSAYRERFDQAIIDHLPCLNPQCKRPITPRDGEDLKHYRRRKCCNVDCANATMWVTRKGGAPAMVRRPATLTDTGTRGTIQSVEDYLKLIGVTRCPTRYATRTIQGALEGREARKRIDAIEIKDEPSPWRKSNNAIFGYSSVGPKP
jgi:hypothetical protein